MAQSRRAKNISIFSLHLLAQILSIDIILKQIIICARITVSGYSGLPLSSTPEILVARDYLYITTYQKYSDWPHWTICLLSGARN